MTGLWIPISLAIIGGITALVAYRGVQRGGSRFYQLERDALLRQASFYQLASIVLFVGAVIVPLIHALDDYPSLSSSWLSLVAL